MDARAFLDGTPLYHAANKGQGAVARLLIDQGDIKVENITKKFNMLQSNLDFVGSRLTGKKTPFLLSKLLHLSFLRETDTTPKAFSLCIETKLFDRSGH